MLKHVVSSTAEAERDTLFVNARQVKCICLTLDKIGHLQSPTQIRCDNSTASGICTGTLKRKRVRDMDMRCFRISDQQDQNNVDVQLHLRQEKNMFSRYHDIVPEGLHPALAGIQDRKSVVYSS